MSAPHPPPCNSCQRWLADGGGGCCRICSAAIQLTRLIGNQAFTAADFGDLSSRLTTLVGEYVVKVGTPDLTRAVAYSISPRQSGGLLIQPGIRAGEGGEAASHRRSGFESPTVKAPPAPPSSGAASTGTDRATSRPRASRAGRSPRRDRKRSRSSGDRRRRRDRSSPSPRDRRGRERETRVPEPALPPRSERTASSWRPSLAAARGTSAQPSKPLGLQPAVRPRGPISAHLPTEPRLVRRPPQSPQPAGREDLDKPPLQRRSKGEGKKGKSKDSSEKSPLEPKTKPKKKNRGLKRQEWWQQRCAARGRGRGARAAVTTGQEQSEEEAEQATEQEVPDQSPTAEAAEKEASGEDTGAEAAFALEERAARWADAS